MCEPKHKATMIVLIIDPQSPPCGVDTEADNENSVVKAARAAEEWEWVADLVGTVEIFYKDF